MDGWLKTPKGYGCARFRRGPKVSAINAKVVVDNGRPMPGDEAALLKSRRSMRYEDAVALWFQLREYGWTATEPP